MKKKRIKKCRTAKQSKKEFTAKTRVYDLVKRECHDELKKLSQDIRPFVRNVENIDWKHLMYFEFDEDLISKTEFLASNEHSNFNIKYRSLNTLIYRMFEYLGSQEKEA